MVKPAYKRIACRSSQHEVVTELARREEISILELMDRVLWHAWKGLGYDVSEIEKSEVSYAVELKKRGRR